MNNKVKNHIKKTVNQIWYQRLPWYLKPLLIFSALYRFVIFLRRCYYACIKQKHFDVLIIVVGNLTVGGSGKTPLVAWLVKELQAKGFRPGIVSRGYGGNAAVYPCVVTKQSLPEEVGDEPLMLHLQTGAPVVVDPRRPRAVAQLLKQFQCDAVISDDGLQHLALSRDIEIIVIDGQRRFGNGYCLPLGPLRESSSRIVKADFVVVNGTAKKGEIDMQLLPHACVALLDGQTIRYAEITKNNQLHAVAGIGNPDRFFELLRQKGLCFISHAFPDHHRYCQADFAFLQPDERVVMTEKDAVKCQHFADSRFYYLPVSAILPTDFADKLYNRLKSIS